MNSLFDLRCEGVLRKKKRSHVFWDLKRCEESLAKIFVLINQT